MAFSTSAIVAPTSPIWEQKGTGTPIVSFDGNSVGVTYTRQIFNWQRLGDWVLFHGRVTLSSKGTSTGSLRIGAGAFPFATADANVSGFPVTVRPLSMTSGVGDSYFVGDVIGGTPAPSVFLRLYKYASGTQVTINNADLTNTSDLIFNGQYRVD